MFQDSGISWCYVPVSVYVFRGTKQMTGNAFLLTIENFKCSRPLPHALLLSSFPACLEHISDTTWDLCLLNSLPRHNL